MPFRSQTSLAPSSSATALAASPTAVASSSQTNVCPPKFPTRSLLWTRLPALRTMTATVAGSQSQAQGTCSEQNQGYGSNPNAAGNPAPPSIAFPDRIATTRMLLSDIQASMQKLSAHMEVLGSRSEQALKEVQLARESLDAGGDKTIAEISDTVYKSQATLIKSFEAHSSMLDKANDRIARLLSDSVIKLYEAQAALQSQHAQLITKIAPIEPLVRSIPSHIDALSSRFSRFTDALSPAIERAVERSVERALARLPIPAYSREQSDQGQQTPRGVKRKRTLILDDVPPINPTQIRSLSRAARSSSMQEVLTPSSPSLRRHCSINRATPRLRPYPSLRRSSTGVVNSSSAGIDIISRKSPPAPSLQSSVQTAMRESKRQRILSVANAAATTGSENNQFHTPNIAHATSLLDGPANGDANSGAIAVTEENRDASTATTDGPVNNTTSSARTTRSVTLASERACGSAARATLKSRESTYLSVNNGSKADRRTAPHDLPATDVGNQCEETVLGTTNHPTDLNARNSRASAKSKSKAPKSKGAGSGKRRGRPKKSAAINDTNGASAFPNISSTAEALQTAELVDGIPTSTLKGAISRVLMQETCPNGTTNVSDKGLGQLDSISTGNKRSLDAPNVPIAGAANVERSASASATLKETSNERLLIDCMGGSQDSLLLDQIGNEGEGGNATLVAAIAHMNSDVDFISGLDMFEVQQTNEQRNAGEKVKNRGKHYLFSDSREVRGSSSTGTGSLSSGRPKRFLVVDNDSTAVDLFVDELFD
ncbi:uncharacterized protein FOMMEDRAFT_24920 [Fomitiporia mediterranea MF3/22]|uniref:uncharacterized protein n=1 Tax=Fomitiporia mediterranea (strain MF3/22) TaxID=694068 RepID=UPI0004407CF6|nr:uncharacterized protein FOMMEDRAFT_24920 [Fomitiporia mediterranea MF3/22]EJD07587.1 hypothetical protein FOMMEDRAFT_24920 [Fomitiporia mediterranea MF3/22]